MEIRKVSNNMVLGYETKQSEQSKNEQKPVALGVATAVSSFENLGKTQNGNSNNVELRNEQIGSRDLNLDQSQLAGNVNLETLPSDTSTTDNRSKYENVTNPFKKDDSENGSDRIRDRQNGATDRSGPTGPDYSSTINQVLSGDRTISQDKYAEYQDGKGRTASDLRKGASGETLMEDAKEASQGVTKDYNVKQDESTGGAGYNAGYNQGEGVKGGGSSNTVLNNAVKGAYLYGGSTTRAETFREAEKDFYDQDGSTSKTGKDGTTVTKGNDGSTTVTKPDGSSTTTYKDGSYVDKDKDGKVTGKGGSLTQPVDDQEKVPIEDVIRMSPGAILPRQHSNGGDIDPVEDETPKGAVIDNSYLERVRLRNVGQPADPESGSAIDRGFRGFPSSGDIDYGPDSPESGFSGTPRGGEATDVDFNVGSTIEQPKDDSNTEEDNKKKKTSYTRPFSIRA